mgnify:CR=1 FL=1
MAFNKTAEDQCVEEKKYVYSVAKIMSSIIKISTS